MHPLNVLFGDVDDRDREDQARVLPVVNMPGLTAPVGHQRVDLFTDFQRGSQIWCGSRAGWETSDSRMTSRSFFFLKPSVWKRNSSGSSGSSATARAAVSSTLSGWYSQVKGRGWEKLTSTVLFTLATFLGTTNGADT